VAKVRVDDFQKWFPEPEKALQEFLNSGQAIMNIVFDGGRRIIELSQRDAANLLAEIQDKKDED
jgi:hypothetical protein